MKPLKTQLLSSTVIPVLLVAGVLTAGGPAQSVVPSPKQVAANPCAAKNPAPRGTRAIPARPRTRATLAPRRTPATPAARPPR